MTTLETRNSNGIKEEDNKKDAFLGMDVGSDD